MTQPNKQSTLGEINKAVREGIQAAKNASTTTDMNEFLDEAENAWDRAYSEFILLMVSLSSLKKRTPAQIVESLERFMKNSKRSQIIRPLTMKDVFGEFADIEPEGSA